MEYQLEVIAITPHFKPQKTGYLSMELNCAEPCLANKKLKDSGFIFPFVPMLFF
jgi:hypothetical protein